MVHMLAMKGKPLLLLMIFAPEITGVKKLGLICALGAGPGGRRSAIRGNWNRARFEPKRQELRPSQASDGRFQSVTVGVDWRASNESQDS